MEPHPLEPLSAEEVARASSRALAHAAQLSLTVRFNTISLAEPPKQELLAWTNGNGPRPARRALCVLTQPPSADVIEALVELSAAADSIAGWRVLDGATLDGQPMATPDDCLLAEAVVRADEGVAEALAKRGIDPATLFLDPWAVVRARCRRGRAGVVGLSREAPHVP